MGRPSNTQERRTQIAQALLAVMARQGYDRTSIGDIAAAAGLTPGLLHYHFATKLEILIAALELMTARHRARLEAAFAAAVTPTAQVAAFIDLHLAVGAQADPDAVAVWVLMSGEALREPAVGAVHQAGLLAVTDLLTGAIERGVSAADFVCDQPRAAAGALIAAIQGYFVLAASARAVIPAGSAARATRQMAEGLLRPPRPFAPARRKSR